MSIYTLFQKAFFIPSTKVCGILVAVLMLGNSALAPRRNPAVNPAFKLLLHLERLGYFCTSLDGFTTCLFCYSSTCIHPPSCCVSEWIRHPKHPITHRCNSSELVSSWVFEQTDGNVRVSALDALRGFNLNLLLGPTGR